MIEKCSAVTGKRTEIKTIQAFMAAGYTLDGMVMQNLDFAGTGINWAFYSVKMTYFLGCTFESNSHKVLLLERGALVFPEFEGLPYDPYRQRLYTWQELMTGFSFEEEKDESLDKKIYQHFMQTGRDTADIIEALARRIHDHAIDSALAEAIQGQKLVGVCGGHSTPRTDPYYKKVAHLARLLAAEGYLLASGGGPGIMEACNLGAYFSAYSQDELDGAIEFLGHSPKYSDKGHTRLAYQIIQKFPAGNPSLAIPTWFYGHEPSNLFASQIAKYFSNSIREDGLLAIAQYGIIFAPGSAGTTQEIFMDAVQNHYGTFSCYSPMIFLGSHRYSSETSIFPLIQQLAQGKIYQQLMTLTDNPLDAVSFIKQHPPIPVNQ